MRTCGTLTGIPKCFEFDDVFILMQNKLQIDKNSQKITYDV